MSEFELPPPKKRGRKPGPYVRKEPTKKTARQITKRYRSFYEAFASKFPDAEKVTETPEGLLEILDSNDQVVWRQMTPQHLVDQAKSRGISVGQILKEQRLTKANEHILAAYKKHVGLPKTAEVQWDDPEFRKYLSSVMKDGVYPYDSEVAQSIADRFAAGERLPDILGKDPYPNMQCYMRWKARYKEFFNLMEEAKKLRADVHISDLEHVTDTVTENNSKAARVKSENLKHLAAVSDPERYGNRTKLVGDKDQPLAFTFNTGIVRPEDKPLIENKAEEDENPT
jgi:hypothetical protein